MFIHPSGQGHRKHAIVKAKAYSEGYVWGINKGELHCFGELCSSDLKCHFGSQNICGQFYSICGQFY
jgi:hypothetical protein